MSLVEFLIAFVILCLVWFGVTRLVPMPEVLSTIFNVIVAIVALFLFLALLGIVDPPFALK